MTTFFTIGYEGVEIGNWINKLKDNGVSLIIDVREKPISRKRGFSKKSLNYFLQDNGISYIHLSDLGSPTEIRNELYETNNYPLFFKKYLSHLCKQVDALSLIVEKSINKKTCLMCFERDPLKCHRSVITDYLLARYPEEMQVKHL
jgi:uncharacterized protein (DUF488 family)